MTGCSILFIPLVQAEDHLFDLPAYSKAERPITIPKQTKRVKQRFPILFYFASKSMEKGAVLRTWSEVRRQHSLRLITVTKGYDGKAPSEFAQNLTGIPNPIVEHTKNIPTIWVDPLLFRRYTVTAVPTWILVQDFNPRDPHHESQTVYRIVGDLSFREVLERFRQVVPSNQIPELTAAITELQQNWWQAQDLKP